MALDALLTESRMTRAAAKVGITQSAWAAAWLASASVRATDALDAGRTACLCRRGLSPGSSRSAPPCAGPGSVAVRLLPRPLMQP